MSENTEHTADAGDNTQPEQSQEQSFSQDDVNRIVQDRLDRERKKFEGFDEYKAAAERLQSVETEKQKLADQVAEFEAKTQHDQLVAEVAESSGVPQDLLRGSTKEELEAHAEQLMSHLKASGPVIPGQEHKPKTVTSDPMREFTKNLFAQAE